MLKPKAGARDLEPLLICDQRLSMPWTPTKGFAHSLTRTRASGVDVGAANIASYHLMEMVLAQGTRSPLNKLRRKTLDLEPIDITYTAGLLDRFQVPTTYLWSPCLVPKPSDWGDHITIAGACKPVPGLDYDPPPTLVKFLEAGPKPIYVGFGSIVDRDPGALTNIILEAIEMADVRAIAFHVRLPANAMRCSLDPSRAAVWKLSSHSKREFQLSPREPFSGSTIAVTKDIYGVFKGFGEIGASIDRSARKLEQAVARRHRDPVDTAKIAQGEWEYHESSEVDRQKVLAAWKALSL
nr:hypothetical protein B0A51_00919 [Rachicladosporium sp. CCFEE 5018]